MSTVKVEKWTGGIGLLPMGFFLLKTEAIQLAKDLLKACDSHIFANIDGAAKVLTFGEPIVGSEMYEGRFLVYTEHAVWEVFADVNGQLRQKLISSHVDDPPVHSGMSLDEIETEAWKMHDQLRYDVGDGYVEKTLAFLIANLAARVKEQKPANQKNKELMDLLGDWEVYANELRKRIYVCEAIIAIYEK